jgi:hypothetical protein
MSQNLRMSSTQLSSEAAWHKRLLFSLTDWGLFSAGVVNLAVGTWSALKGEVAIAATSLTAGLVLLFSATIDRFESLKGLGIEAKTRQLDQKIAQADEIFRKLREVTEFVVLTLANVNSGMGRLGSASSTREAYAWAQNVRYLLTSLGSDTSSIRQALESWVRIFCFDLVRAITTPLETALYEKTRELGHDPAAIREISTYREHRLHTISEFHVEDYPNRFLRLLEDVPFVSEEVLAPIQAKARQFAPAMLELRQNQQLANPEPWFLEIEEYRKRP